MQRSKQQAVRWQHRAQGFRQLPTWVRWVLGGQITQAALELVADQALEDYLNEAIQWH